MAQSCARGERLEPARIAKHESTEPLRRVGLRLDRDRMGGLGLAAAMKSPAADRAPTEGLRF